MNRALGITKVKGILLAVLFLAACDDKPVPPEEVPTDTPREEAAESRQDHYLCYRESAPTTRAYETVHLKDQFFSSPVSALPDHTTHRRFCNPVDKKHAGREFKRKHHDDHLLALAVTLPLQERDGQATVYNQFYPEGQVLTIPVNGKRFLMLPTKKINVEPRPDGWEGHGSADYVDHFLCYQATDASTRERRPVDLVDQMSVYQQVEVGQARLLCNPSKKWHGAAPPEPNALPDGIRRFEKDHLACYEVNRPASYEITFYHQLTPLPGSPPGPAPQESLTTSQLDWLCVPSAKDRGQGWWPSSSEG